MPRRAHNITKAHLDEVKDKIARLTPCGTQLEARVAGNNKQISECRIIEALADHASAGTIASGNWASIAFRG
ncbi:hypothetical protein DC522_32050 [Microvirga sp. KLBC 81]|nr:hypothetical protein DC522_32050 [Microvirga sp. KLBC 81]